MAAGIPARLTTAEGRKFGFTVGAAFLVIAAVLWWRGRHLAGPILAGMGGLLVLAGLFIPGSLGPVYRVWMGLGTRLSKVTTPVFMGVMYFVILFPIGLLRRIFGGNPLVRTPSETGYWISRDKGKQQRSNMERQF